MIMNIYADLKWTLSMLINPHQWFIKRKKIRDMERRGPLTRRENGVLKGYNPKTNSFQTVKFIGENF